MFENLPDRFRPALSIEPRETRATCSSCVMARADWPKDARDPGPFDTNLKCCTFEPFLPNFTVGRLIEAGRWDDVVKAGRLTPVGLIPSRSSVERFGREGACAFLREGRCSIHAERPSVCRTYFCVSDFGQDFWAEAERLGNEAEWSAAHEVLWEMGFTEDDVGFAEWTGREREFFLQCARLAFDPTAGGE